MNLQKFATELYKRIETWLEPQFKSLNDQLSASKTEVDSLKSQIETITKSIPSPVDTDKIIEQAKNAVEIPQPLTKEEIEDIVFSEKLDSLFEERMILLSAAVEDVKKQIPAHVDVEGLIGKSMADFRSEQEAKIGEIESDFFGESLKNYIDEQIQPVKQSIEERLESYKPENGKDGSDGRDGVDIEIMPFLDKEKSYPRGMYAMHNGGLWRSYMQTDGIKGWDCIVKGYPDITIEQKNDRDIVVKSVNTIGEEKEHVFSVPVMIYRGVWVEGNYQKGDTVTRGGSIWYADKDTDTRPGAQDCDWSLAVKKGRDGRSGE